ncbi:MAG TPA: hypothetical protein VFP89_00045 [Propionibacteriaceae bacterium]|nr:hypothetical protein [Propionibacteriaceae bacterium]
MAQLVQYRLQIDNLAVLEPEEHCSPIGSPLLIRCRAFPFSRVHASTGDQRHYLVVLSHHLGYVDVVLAE